jgi:hypothetical protein
MASFRDKYPDLGGGNWVSGDEKDVIIEQGIPFEITSVQDDDANKYGPRFVLQVVLPNPETGDEEDRQIGFAKGTVESRDRDLTNLKSFLADDEAEKVLVKLTKVGNAQILEFQD